MAIPANYPEERPDVAAPTRQGQGVPADLPLPPSVALDPGPAPSGGGADAANGPSSLGDPSQTDALAPPSPPRSFIDRVEAYISRLSTRNNFWHRVCSLIWLPLAFKSGIKMKRIDATTFTAILPFRRFNRNFYNAMAGAALLANSEIAGGMYVFGVCGGDYTVVCKHLEYKFLRPCFGPAVYRISPKEDIVALRAAKGEFNITLDLEIVQQLKKPWTKERRVGRCAVTFHVTPKAQHQAKRDRPRRAASAA